MSVSHQTRVQRDPVERVLPVAVILREHLGERVFERQRVPVERVFPVAVILDERLADLERQRVPVERVLLVFVSLREHVAERVFERQRVPVELVFLVAVIQAINLGRGDVDHEVPEPVDVVLDGGATFPTRAGRWDSRWRGSCCSPPGVP